SWRIRSSFRMSRSRSSASNRRKWIDSISAFSLGLVLEDKPTRGTRQNLSGLTAETRRVSGTVEADGGQEGIDVDRLGEVGVETGLEQAFPIPCHGLRGHREHRDRGRP